MGDITSNFSYKEFERSQKANELGIDNSIPDDVIRKRIRGLAEDVLQPLRDRLTVLCQPHPIKIRITSGYRCPELNEAIGGSDSSFHLFGYAADCELLIKIGGSWQEKNALLFHSASVFKFTELIWEYGVKDPTPYKSKPAWVHIAYNPQDNRRMIKYIS